ncbi:dihydropyrimidinase [Sulfoacidibacillus thermotolerans]|uniref:Dihydropyrimidinase n=1 Tax=Sulfoacidibacillus thermotolerans TaxID=1765684 RepID=A0A2U3D995_SULT2|nr:dihydropyrimidinase [Sulfoacidibacillus thermotolerans]PWI57835.1 dihydropyrimidinase [Sulfoacidibacillus thermotolerans]
MRIIISGGTVVTASDIVKADVLVEGGIVTAIAQQIAPDDHEIVNAAGCYIFPGGIDPHTHLDMPFGGTVTADDFRTGTIAAAFGGTTTVIDFALHSKGDTLRNAVATWHAKADGKAVIDYAFHVMVGDMRPEVMEEIPLIVEEEGITSFKVFMAYKNNLQVDDETLFRVLRMASQVGALVQVHAENGDVIEVLVREALAKGQFEPKYHALTRPKEAEGEATARAIRLAEIAGAPLYVVHVTCAEAADAISDARKRGLPIYGETCPQYLVCDETDYERPDFEGAKYVMSPPLRAKYHQEVLWGKLKNMELQAFGSDQCSFNLKGQKELGRHDFSKIPNGSPTIEDRMAILYHFGVHSGKIGLNQFVALTSANPAKLFGLYPRKGTIAVGADADLVVWDPQVQRTISATTHHMNVDNNIFEGMTVMGKPRYVFLRGHKIVDGDQFLGKPGMGKFQRCERFAPFPL